MINFDHGYSLALIDSDHEHDIYILSHGQKSTFSVKFILCQSASSVTESEQRGVVLACAS